METVSISAVKPLETLSNKPSSASIDGSTAATTSVTVRTSRSHSHTLIAGTSSSNSVPPVSLTLSPVLQRGTSRVSSGVGSNRGGHHRVFSRRKLNDFELRKIQAKRDKIALPKNFLLGGNINDPLNLGSIPTSASLAESTSQQLDDVVSLDDAASTSTDLKSRSAVKITGSIIDPYHDNSYNSEPDGRKSPDDASKLSQPLDIKIPRNLADPLNLNQSADAFQISPLSGRRTRRRKRRHSFRLSAESIQARSSILIAAKEKAQGKSISMHTDSLRGKRRHSGGLQQPDELIVPISLSDSEIGEPRSYDSSQFTPGPWSQSSSNNSFLAKPAAKRARTMSEQTSADETVSTSSSLFGIGGLNKIEPQQFVSKLQRRRSSASPQRRDANYGTAGSSILKFNEELAGTGFTKQYRPDSLDIGGRRGTTTVLSNRPGFGVPYDPIVSPVAPGPDLALTNRHVVDLSGKPLTKKPSRSSRRRKKQLEKEKAKKVRFDIPTPSNSTEAGHSAGGMDVCEDNKAVIPDDASTSADKNFKLQRFRYGNYNQYYGKRLPGKFDDPRLHCLKKLWFEDKHILDVGCNIGIVTLLLAREFNPQHIHGVDIDGYLISIARKNVRQFLDDQKHIVGSKSGESEKVGSVGSSDISNLDSLPSITLNSRERKALRIEKKRQKKQSSALAQEAIQTQGHQHHDKIIQNKADNFDIDENPLHEDASQETETKESSQESPMDISKGYITTAFPPSFSQIFGPLSGPPVFIEAESHEGASTSKMPLVELKSPCGATCGAPLPRFRSPKRFPRNVTFAAANYFLENKELVSLCRPKYDVILMLSVTKWIHLNWADAGITTVFRRAFAELKPGGLLVVEPQAFVTYKKRVLSKEIEANFKSIEIVPEKFPTFLTSPEIGFGLYELAGMPYNKSKGFRRPVQLYWKPPVPDAAFRIGMVPELPVDTRMDIVVSGAGGPDTGKKSAGKIHHGAGMKPTPAAKVCPAAPIPKASSAPKCGVVDSLESAEGPTIGSPPVNVINKMSVIRHKSESKPSSGRKHSEGPDATKDPKVDTHGNPGALAVETKSKEDTSNGANTGH